MIELIAVFVAGFITGILIARNNIAKVNRAVEDVANLYEKAQAEIAELKTKVKKPAKKPAKKKTVKRPQVD